MPFKAKQPARLYSLIIGAICCVFLTWTAFAVANSDKEIRVLPADEPHIIPWISYLKGNFSEIQRLLSQQLLRGTFNAEDFEKLDFSLPGDSSFGDDPMFEVFNANGGFRAVQPSQDAIDHITTQEGVRVIFNLRRHIDQTGKIQDNLYAIVPDVLLAECKAVADKSEYDDRTHPEPFVEVHKDLEIVADNHHIVIDETPLPRGGICVRMPNGRLYLFSFLGKRVKQKESDAWLPTR